jgi:hypothetical protein
MSTVAAVPEETILPYLLVMKRVRHSPSLNQMIVQADARHEISRVVRREGSHVRRVIKEDYTID